MEHKRFRAAYDFLLLRAHAGEEEQALADWWTRYQQVDAEGRDDMARTQAPAPGAARRKRRPRKRRATPRDAG